MNNLQQWLLKDTHLSKYTREEFVSWLKERQYPNTLPEDVYDDLFILFADEWLSLNHRKLSARRNPSS